MTRKLTREEKTMRRIARRLNSMAILLDPKGELAAITARKRAEFGRVIILNPFELIDEAPHLKSAGCNPLRQLDKGSEDRS